MFIEFGIWSNHLLIPLLYPVFYQIKVFLIPPSVSNLYQVFLNFLGYLFAGVIYLFYADLKQLTKKKIINLIKI